MTSNTTTRCVPIAMLPTIIKAAELAEPVFLSNEWTYAYTHPNIPGVNVLTETIANLIATLLEDEDKEVTSTGRFIVYREYEDWGAVRINIALDLGTYYFEDE